MVGSSDGIAGCVVCVDCDVQDVGSGVCDDEEMWASFAVALDLHVWWIGARVEAVVSKCSCDCLDGGFVSIMIV